MIDIHYHLPMRTRIFMRNHMSHGVITTGRLPVFKTNIQRSHHFLAVNLIAGSNNLLTVKLTTENNRICSRIFPMHKIMLTSLPPAMTPGRHRPPLFYHQSIIFTFHRISKRQQCIKHPCHLRHRYLLLESMISLTLGAI